MINACILVKGAVMLSSFWKQNKGVKYLGLTSLFLVALRITGCSVKQPHQVAIASAHPLATQAGFEILQKGGNVYDAAVAVSAALAVVEPSGSGLGGGGFWLLHRKSDDLNIMIDGREKAPLAAHKDMFLNASGEANTQLSLNGVLAAGIPAFIKAIKDEPFSFPLLGRFFEAK